MRGGGGGGGGGLLMRGGDVGGVFVVGDECLEWELEGKMLLMCKWLGEVVRWVVRGK